MVRGLVAADRVWLMPGATGRSFLRKGHDDDGVVLAGMRIVVVGSFLFSFGMDGLERLETTWRHFPP